MKKLMFVLVMMIMFIATACTFSTKKSTDKDSTIIDSTQVDSTSVDSVIIDSTMITQ